MKVGWVFFIFSVVERLTGRGWAAAIYPAGAPQPPAHPELLHITGSKTGRTRCKADHARHDTHAQTLDTLHRSALDTRQDAPGRSYRRRALDVVERVRNCADLDATQRLKKISHL